MANEMQLCRIIYFSLAALHVSSDIFVHHQEHLNCITVCGITHVCRCRLVSWKYIYFFLAVLHVSSDIFARHQEHLNCITASGITHICRCRLISWECSNTPMIPAGSWVPRVMKRYSPTGRRNHGRPLKTLLDT